MTLHPLINNAPLAFPQALYTFSMDLTAAGTSSMQEFYPLVSRLPGLSFILTQTECVFSKMREIEVL